MVIQGGEYSRRQEGGKKTSSEQTERQAGVKKSQPDAQIRKSWDSGGKMGRRCGKKEVQTLTNRKWKRKKGLHKGKKLWISKNLKNKHGGQASQECLPSSKPARGKGRGSSRESPHYAMKSGVFWPWPYELQNLRTLSSNPEGQGQAVAKMKVAEKISYGPLLSEKPPGQR